jgi:LacI family transcriptional regulator
MASQTEIARLAGVSQSVVSRVLNGRAAQFGIAADTAARVATLAARLGYRPDPAARMLLGGASKLVGVVVRSFDDPFLAVILQELNRRSLASGHTLLVVGLEGDDAHRAEEVRLVQRYRPDALIVVGSTDFGGWPPDLFPTGQPLVQIGLPSPDPRVVSCGLDEVAAAAALAHHLHARGHRRFALVGDACAASHARARLLRAALRDLPGPVVLAADFLSPHAEADAGAHGATFLLDETTVGPRPTAVLATGDLIALGILRTLRERGIHVPDTMVVAGYDDLPVAAWVSPALTTLRQPVRELAAAAMAIATGEAPATPVLVPGELIIRASTTPPAP